MSEYPIEGLMNTAMNSIKEMVDVNTIVGYPIQTSNNVVIIPISKVGFGFAAGGSEFNSVDRQCESNRLNPFGGGAGAGVSIKPVAFLVVREDIIRLLPIDHNNSYEKIIDSIPQLIETFKGMVVKQDKNVNESFK